MNTAFLLKAIQFLALGVMLVLFFYAKMQKPSAMQNYASMVSLNTALMLFGSLLEMQASTLEGAYYGTVLTYIGEPFLLVSVFLLVSTFYGVKIRKWMFAIMVTVALCITAAVYTNPYHHLYYSYVGYNPNAVFSPLVLEHGPLYLLNIATIVFYNSGIAVLVITGYKKSVSPLKRRLSVYSLLMMICAVSGIVVYFFDIADGYDTTMLGLTAAAIFLTILFFRCRIFDVVDMAKDYALDRSAEGLLVYDDSGSVVYKNAVASQVVGTIIPEAYINEMIDEKTVYKEESSVYSVNASSIKHKNDYLGKSVEIYDITETYLYQERLETAVAEATQKLESIQRTILGSFASLVEARSLETGDHIKRVSQYTAQIVEELRKNETYRSLLTDDYVNMLIHSAPLHDVGKISISDTILLKPGKLTPEEFEEMKKHSEMGAGVIKTTMEGLESESYVKMASEIALYHHERWDGTGYPTGRKGTEIPLSARIVAVADCYDAMTSERCYKAAFSEEKAIAILKEESGTHFDPKVIEAFLHCRQP